ncbi:MAG TPA: hypothetical protein VLQ91_14600, partial [Draconibacterium sp.]|nr:hypothetical protein [Draconibacterium sp.]
MKNKKGNNEYDINSTHDFFHKDKNRHEEIMPYKMNFLISFESKKIRENLIFRNHQFFYHQFLI